MISADSPATRKLAAEIVSTGGLIAFRTDTFYGLGVDPFNQNALLRINQVKGREGKPILLLIDHVSSAERVMSTRPELFGEATKLLWPGPLTLVVPAVHTLAEEITAGTETVGVRLPNDESVRELVRNCGGALTATSANLAGGRPARSAAEVEGYFPTGIDLIIDSGEVSVTEPSTVLDIVSKPPRLIREGVISREQIELALGIAIE